jgi:membrane protein implicated in regulation of membrane protease activity
MNWAAVIWLVLLVVFLAAEASTVTLISLWFAAGALAALLASLTGGGVPFQVFLFLAVSVAAMAALRPLVRKYITPKLTPTNTDSIIGTTGYVTGDIDNDAAQGQVKLGGMFWTARSTSGAPVAAGTLIRVDRIEGVKVYVSPAEVSAQV